MKILYLAPEPGISYDMSGGAGTHIRGTVAALQRQGHTVGVAVGGDLLRNHNGSRLRAVETYSVSKANSIGAAVLGYGKVLVPRFARRLFHDTVRAFRTRHQVQSAVRDFLKQFGKPDIIYERSAVGLATGNCLRDQLCVPLCIETDADLIEGTRALTTCVARSLFYGPLERWKLQTADSLVVMSEGSRQRLRDKWAIRHDSIYVKGLGVSRELFNDHSELPNKDPGIMQAYSLYGKCVIGYVGIFQDYQNLPLLMAAAEKLRNKTNYRFLVVGTGRRLHEYREYARKMDLHNLCFTGHIPKEQIARFFRCIDVGVITDNLSHMYPVKYLEFLAHGVPTVFPRHEPFRTFFEDIAGYDFFSFRPGDAQSLSETIVGVIDDWQRALGCTQALKDLVLRSYTWDATAERLTKALEETVRRARQSAGRHDFGYRLGHSDVSS